MTASTSKEARRIGGGLLAAVAVAIPTVLELMDVKLPEPVGIAMLAVCFAILFLGLVLAFRTEKLAAPTERSLPAAFIGMLSHRAPAGLSVQVRRYDQSAEAAEFERQLVASLLAAGWRAGSFGYDAGTVSFRGTMLESGNVDSEAFKVLRLAFQKSRIHVATREVPEWESNFIRVGIGALG